jgi:hypothetical protein
MRASCKAIHGSALYFLGQCNVVALNYYSAAKLFGKPAWLAYSYYIPLA